MNEENVDLAKLSPEQEDTLIRDVHYGNLLQKEIFETLNISKDIDAILNYSPLIRKIIQDHENQEIRELILKEDFKGAAKLVIAKIKENSAN
jgi:hypothetical protein